MATIPTMGNIPQLTIGSLDNQATPSLRDTLYLYYDGESWEFEPGETIICWRRYIRSYIETPEQFYHRVINKCNMLNGCVQEELNQDFPGMIV